MKDGKWVDHTFSCRCLAEVSEKKRLGYFILMPVMLISLIFGVRLFLFDTPVVYSRRYDDLKCPASGAPCTIVIDVEKNMLPPIYFNYQLVNFYQSHRVYLNSKSDDQLKGSVLNTQSCNPSRSLNGLPIYPCGLLPQSIFTDRFFIDVERGNVTKYLCLETSCPRNERNISWENYWDLFAEEGTWERTGTWGGVADSKFMIPDTFPSADSYTRDSLFLNDTKLQLPYPDNSDMIVWLRTAPRTTFKKPFRVIKNYGLFKGDTLHVHFFNYFNPGELGMKYFSLETSPGYGTKTTLLGALCLGIGIGSSCMFTFVMSGIGHRTIMEEEMLKDIY